jgi:ribosome-associated toxin RatA of RatAB toxin-antitoxin module
VHTSFSRGLAALLAAGAIGSAHAGDDSIRPYLERGPLVLVEQDGAGKFSQATALVLVDASVEKVWETLTGFDKYTEFMPKVTTSQILRKTDTEMDVRFVIDVPGPDEDYVVRYAVDEKKHELKGTWLKGDLKGSRWTLRAEATADGKTLLSHAASVRNFSSFAQSIEDDQQTITIGVNVSSVLAATKGIKRRAEGHVAAQK